MVKVFYVKEVAADSRKGVVVIFSRTRRAFCECCHALLAMFHPGAESSPELPDDVKLYSCALISTNCPSFP
jgi:RNase P subunit RPR2